MQVSAVADPLSCADVFPQLLRHALHSDCQKFRGDGNFPRRRFHFPAVCHQPSGLFLSVPVIHFQQRLQGEGNLHAVPACFRQIPQTLSKRRKVPGIGGGEGDAFAPFPRHVQPVVPVRAPQTHEAVLAHVVKGRHVLDEQMLQYGAFTGCTGVFQRTALAPVGKGVPEIGLPFQQKIQIAGFVQIQLNREHRPEAVIHPHSGDAVPVGLEFPGLCADDGGVRPVGADAGKVAQKILPGLLRGGQQQGKAVLPEIPPAPAAPAVIVVGQEAAPADAAQQRLNAHPAQPAVEGAALGADAPRGGVLPEDLRPFQRRRYRFRRQIGGGVGVHGQDDLIACYFSGRQRPFGEEQGGDDLTALRRFSGVEMVDVLRGDHCLRPVVASGADKVPHQWDEALRACPGVVLSPYPIGQLPFLVPPLVEGQRRAEVKAMFAQRHPLQKAGDVAVIPDIVCRAAVQGDRCRRGEGQRRFAGVFQCDLHDFHGFLPGGNEAQNLCQQSGFRLPTGDLLPQQTAG